VRSAAKNSSSTCGFTGSSAAVTRAAEKCGDVGTKVCTNTEQLYRELRGLGYRGANTVVRQYVRSWWAGYRPP
jgi:hypothetical protein